MIIDNTNLLIDTDALIKLMDINKRPEDVIRIIKNLFEKLKRKALLHPLVYGKEFIIKTHILSQLINQKIIQVPTIQDIYSNDDIKKQIYIMYVSDFYHQLNAQPIPAVGDDVLTYWNSHESLGESHSVATCVLNECDLFLSDDDDSKTLEKMVEERQMGTLHVYRRSEIIDVEDATELSRSEKRAIAHK